MKASIAALIATSTASFAGDLVINFDDPNPGPKAGFEAAVEAFKAENPDINVLYVHQGGILGNETMLPRYLRKFEVQPA